MSHLFNAKETQNKRFKDLDNVYCNSQMYAIQIRNFCEIDDESQALLKMALTKLKLSARAYNRILKVARTIAYLDSSEKIQTKHISEAIQFRSLDRKYNFK